MKGIVIDDYPSLGGLLRVLLEQSAKTLEKVVLFNDTFRAFLVPQTVFPKMHHLTIEGSVPTVKADGRASDTFF